MRQYLLLFSLVLAATVTAHGQNSRPRPTPTPPPPVTEVYATASDSTPLTWTVYTPAGRGPWPAVLVIHGGLFLSGDASEGAACAQDLAAAGYVAYSINYRLAPPGSIPGQVSLGRSPDQYNDVHLAVQAARDDSRSTGKVGAVGGSAGATHAVWASTTGTAGQDRLDAAAGLSGAYDFSDFSPDDNLMLFMFSVTNYVGVPSTDTVSLRAASPAWVVGKKVAPLYLIDSEGDLMPAVQLDDMVSHLTTVGAHNYTAMTIAGDLHSFANWPLVKDDILAFLAPILKKTR